MKSRLLIIICWIFVLCVSALASSDTTNEIQVHGDRLSGVVLPVLPRATDITISALRANAWTVDDTKRLLLEHDVVITIGAYTFESEKAVIWINRMPTDAGVVSQIAVYMNSFAKTSRRGGLGAEGQDLLVVGSTLGSVSMDVALMKPVSPSSHPLVHKAESRLAGYVQGLTNSPPPLSSQPQVIVSPRTIDSSSSTVMQVPIQNEIRPWLKPQSGFVSIAADLVELRTGTDENIVTLAGHVDVELRSSSGTDDMQMTATRGIIFMDPGSISDIASGKVDVSDIHGVYLEGNVVIIANNGNYLIRAPQIYYDFDTGKAMMVESVLRTYIKGNVPLYVRADEMRQLSSNEWTAQGVLASTSSFATPDLAIGAASMTITQQDDGITYIKSKDNTLRLGGKPIMYWPYYEGEAGKIPLRGVRIEFNETKGAIVQTKWDLFTLVGVHKPSGLSMDLSLDTFSKRGVGAGLEIDYVYGKNNGKLDVYLMTDSSTQKTVSGIVTPVLNSERGYALLTNRAQISPNWTIQTQLSYISDPTFMSVWRQRDYNNHPEYETSIYAKYQSGNAAFTALVKSDLNQFISTSWLLASRQYKVDKAPEFGYYRYGDTLLNGLVSWSSETRLMRERMVFQSGTPAELGLRRGAFAFPSGTIIDSADAISAPLRAAGLTEAYRERVTTRHEFSMPLQYGDVIVVPFASIQAQKEFDSDSDDSTDWIRTVGVRASTQFHRIYNNVNNDLLDLHRLRHVIEPYVTLWNSDSNINPLGINQYDALVDNVAIGSVIWFGVRNRLQTWRGGPGRWYEVDWITIDASILFANNGATQRYDNPQFYNWRPEYSSIEDAAILSGKWQFSDGIAFIGNGTWGLDHGTFSRGSFGAELDHGRDVRTYIEYREIGITGDQYLSMGLKYELSKRYSFNFSPSWNFKIDELQSLHFAVTRHYPEFDLVALVNYNEIQDETQYGFRFNLLKF